MIVSRISRAQCADPVECIQPGNVLTFPPMRWWSLRELRKRFRGSKQDRNGQFTARKSGFEAAYWGKTTPFGILGEGDGNVGIIRSPARVIAVHPKSRLPARNRL